MGEFFDYEVERYDKDGSKELERRLGVLPGIWTCPSGGSRAL